MTEPITRADYLRGAEEAERLGNFALAGRLKGLALETPAPATTTESAELGPAIAELQTQIAAAESKQDFATAGRLKTELLNVQRAARK